GVNGTDAVNKDQLEKVNSTASAGWNLTVNSSNSSNVAPNATVDLANKDGNIIITKEANNVTFGLNDKLTIGGKDGQNGKIGLDGANGTIGLNGKDGVSANITVKDGKPGVDGKNGTTRIVYEKADGSTEEVATLNDGLIFTGNNEVQNAHKLNSVVKVVGEGVNKAVSDSFKSASGNINVKANGSDTLEIQLNKDIDLTTDGSVTIGDTVVNQNGVTIDNGPSITKDGGVNAGDKKVTNVTAGNVSADSKDAVNGSQLYATNQNVTNITNEVAKGWN
ncbi:YadA domain-containing protein, partial [Actinobacillus minor 202]